MPRLQGLKVCFVAGTLGQGGAERQLFYMMSALKKEGAEPKVLSLTRGEYWEERIKGLGVPVIWVGQKQSRLQRLRAIIHELKMDPPAVVQSQHFYTNIYVALAARFLGLKEIGALRSDAINEVGANSGPLGWLSLRAPRAIAANSRQAIDNAVELGMSRDRLHFLPNVVDTHQFQPAQVRDGSRVRVLTIGRMVRQKRFDRFLRVFAAARRRSTANLQGILVGDGPRREVLETDSIDLSIPDDSIVFQGLKSDVAQFYHRADLLLLTSDWEGTPNVVLEAMACGLPVIATRVGGVANLVQDGESGYLFSPRDEEGLIRALCRLAEDEKHRVECGATARRFVEENHALDKLATELAFLYSRLLVSVDAPALSLQVAQ